MNLTNRSKWLGFLVADYIVVSIYYMILCLAQNEPDFIVDFDYKNMGKENLIDERGIYRGI